MKTKGIGLVACAALAVAGCATQQATPTHRMSVEIVGAESADCVSPQAVGEYAITAPGDFIVEPEAPNVVIICNAEGYQETYASFDEVYNDGSAGAIALGALAFGIMGAAITAGSDGLDSLPNRVTITMVPEGEVHDGNLARAEYEKASETVAATASLAPAYTAAEPPEDSEIAMARAKALASGDQQTAARARNAELRQFETRLRGSKTQLIQALNDYNGETEFARSPYSGKPHKVKSVARVTALEERQGNYVVEMQVTSGFANSNSHEVFDQTFLVNGKHGGLRILAHGQRLMEGRQPQTTTASASSKDTADLERFAARLRSNKPQLVRLLNDYNQKTEFATGQHPSGPLRIKDVSEITVVDAQSDGYVVRLLGNAGVSSSWSADVYNEHFLIDDRDGLRILAHGQRLTDKRQQLQTAALAGSEDGADIERFEARLQANEPQLVRLLNDYNRRTDFAKSSHTGIRLKIRDVSRIDVIQAQDNGYVVRLLGNSDAGRSFTLELYDELFLIDDRRGGLRIMAHGKRLATQDS